MVSRVVVHVSLTLYQPRRVVQVWPKFLASYPHAYPRESSVWVGCQMQMRMRWPCIRVYMCMCVRMLSASRFRSTWPFSYIYMYNTVEHTWSLDTLNARQIARDDVIVCGEWRRLILDTDVSNPLFTADLEVYPRLWRECSLKREGLKAGTRDSLVFSSCGRVVQGWKIEKGS